MYTYIWSRSAAPPTPHEMVWEAPPSVVWVVVGLIGGGWESPSLLVGGKGFPPSPPCGVGSGGWEFPFFLVGGKGFPPGISLPPPSVVWFGVVEFVLGSLGGLVAVVKLL